MNTSIVIQSGAPTVRSRFGITIRKVFGADPRVREHRENLFRAGVAPFEEPTVRKVARWVLVGCGVLLVLSLPAASGGDAVGWILLLLAGIGWALYILLRKSDVDLPAVSTAVFDQMLDHFRTRSEPEALKHLSYDIDEDVFVKQDFMTFDVRELYEVISMRHGLALYPHTTVSTLLVQQEGPGIVIRVATYYRHFVYANQRGLTHACAAWDLIDDELGPDGSFPVPRIIAMNQWTWRTIENLHVGEESLVIQTIGANRVALPYIGGPDRRPDRGPGLYDFYYNTPAAQHRRATRPQPPGGAAFSQPGYDPLADPDFHRYVQDQIRESKDVAIKFVNTVNSLRNEWEDRQ